MYTYQVKTGLVNGLYTLRAWVRGSDWSNTQLEVKDYGGSIRAVHFGTDWTWRQVEIKDINVTNGQATIGIWSNNANTWKSAQFDDVEFFKQ
jgi:arabinogalactan endo-1,4-beta-galactosidase